MMSQEQNRSSESTASPRLTLTSTLTRTFEVRFVDGLAHGDGGALGAALDRRRALVITTPTVDRIYGPALRANLHAQRIEHAYHVLRLGERRKRLGIVKRVCESAARLGLDRRGAIVAVGGGVCMDVVTLSASLIRRGIDHIRVPTTLVGQVDAGIGIKGGVNLGDHKNFLGCFHAPAQVLIDTQFLRTLSPGHIRQGLAEILKMALVADRGLFEELRDMSSALLLARLQFPGPGARRILARAIGLMLDELRENPYENRTFERIVDMGHTFSPVLEAACGFRLPHGEAVSIDMALSCAIAQCLGLMPRSEAESFVDLLWKLGLPIHSHALTLNLCATAIRRAVAHRGGCLNLVVPVTIGQARFLGAEALCEDGRSGNLAALQRALALLGDMHRDRVRAERVRRTYTHGGVLAHEAKPKAL